MTMTDETTGVDHPTVGDVAERAASAEPASFRLELKWRVSDDAPVQVEPFACKGTISEFTLGRLNHRKQRVAVSALYEAIEQAFGDDEEYARFEDFCDDSAHRVDWTDIGDALGKFVEWQTGRPTKPPAR